MRPRLVVFDLDGTLVDSGAQIVAAMQRAFAAMGRPLPTAAEVLAIVGLSLPQAVSRLVPDADPPEVDDIAAAYRATFLAADTAPMLYPGAAEALAALAARPELRLGIATGKGRRGAERVLRHHGLDALFATLQAADGHPSKPHPSMLHAALAEVGADAADAVMVGDSTFDAEMARAAGLRFLGVAWGYHPATALREAGAHDVLAAFPALVPALDSAWQAAA